MPLRTRVPSRTSEATTRTTRSIHIPLGKRGQLLLPGETIASPETGLAYTIDRWLGEGGFGQVYFARREGKLIRGSRDRLHQGQPHIDGWLREAYFGQLLDGHPRAVRIYDVFPLVRPDGQMLYRLALEYAPHGDLRAFMLRDADGWSETAARREIAGVLQVLGRLHRGQLLHRDLTPMNVFVFDERRLKLGDFGIVRQQSDVRGITARTMNTLTAPSEIIAGTVPKWQARDDVFQVGQLLAMLVKGDARSEDSAPRDVRRLPCSDHLKEIVYRCIGERRKRYVSADELIEALRARPADLKPGRLQSLKGVHLAFTGILSRTRTDAMPRRHAAPAQWFTAGRRSRQPWLSAAGRIRCRPQGAMAAANSSRLNAFARRGHRSRSSARSRFWRLVEARRP